MKSNFSRVFQPIVIHAIVEPVIVIRTNNRDFECTKNCILIWNFPHILFRWNFTILKIIVQYLDCVKFRFAIVQQNVLFNERLFELRANNPLTYKNYISSLINALLDAMLYLTAPCAARLLFSPSVLAEAWLNVFSAQNRMFEENSKQWVTANVFLLVLIPKPRCPSLVFEQNYGTELLS